MIYTLSATCNHLQTIEPQELDSIHPTNTDPVIKLANIPNPSNMKTLPGLRGELPPEVVEEVVNYLMDQGGILIWLYAVAVREKRVSVE